MHHFSLIKMFTSFAMMGAEWVMWVLVWLSFISVSIMVERALLPRASRRPRRPRRGPRTEAP